MKQSAMHSAFMLACLPGCVIAVALVAGCAGESQTVSGKGLLNKVFHRQPFRYMNFFYNDN